MTVKNDLKSRKLKRLFFPFLAILLLTPWPVAYAHDAGSAATGQELAQIEIAESAVAPTWTAFGRAIGGVTPGDLFYIDASGIAADITITLYLTNAGELIHLYRYLIMEVGVYAKSSGGWEKATLWNGKPVPDTYITLRNGQVNFLLPGYAKYKISLDSGSFYCFGSNADGEMFSPQFYLTME